MLSELFQPLLAADDGTDIGGEVGEFTAPQEDDVDSGMDDLYGDSGLEAREPAEPEKDMSFKDDPRNKEFAEQRRKEALEAERQKNAVLARNYDIAKKYGADYGVFSEEDIAAKFGTTHGITTLEQFETALENEQYRQAGIDPDLIEKIVEDRLEKHPVLQIAKQQQTTAKIDSQFAELKRDFPESGLKTLDDLVALPTYPAILAKINQGYSMADAYESANRAELRNKAQKAAKQKTLNDINSKQHLNTEGDGEGETNDIHIPPDTMQMYLDMGFTKKQAIEKHKKLYG